MECATYHEPYHLPSARYAMPVKHAKKYQLIYVFYAPGALEWYPMYLSGFAIFFFFLCSASGSRSQVVPSPALPHVLGCSVFRNINFDLILTAVVEIIVSN